MIRLLAAALALLAAPPALAADRSFSIGSFERVRIEGPFEVRIATGTAPAARASGERDQLDRLSIEVNGATLVVRQGTGGWGETPRERAMKPPVITLTTPRLVSAALIAGARVTIARMKAQRIDLSLAGAGALALDQADADQLVATIVGAGTIVLAGRANRARLQTNGPGTIDAAGLVVNDLSVLLDGTGETKAAARYTAQITSSGLGRVTVLGNAKCTVKARADGPVTCGPKL